MLVIDAPTTSASVAAGVTPALKAAGIASSVAVMQAMTSTARFNAYVDTLPRATADLVHRPRLPQSFVELELSDPLLRCAVDGLFDGDLRQLFELGRRQLRNDMSGIYRVFLRVASPAFVADRAAAIYAVYGRGLGTMTARHQTPRSFDLVVMDRPLPSPALFEYLRGSICGALELTGVRDLQVAATPLQAAGSCRFRASWT
ncbi:MAG TPA: hypothetical protein VGF99_02905 [Myxococcota bacterium]